MVMDRALSHELKMEEETLMRGQRQLEGLVFVTQQLLAEGEPEHPIIHSNSQVMCLQMFCCRHIT